MKKLLTILIIIVTVYTFAGTSFDFRSGTSSFEFLRLPVGAVNIALGQCNIASVDTSLALYINPSQLEEIGNWDLHAGYSKWVEDMSYQYFAVGKRIGDNKGVLALGVKNFSYGEFTYTKPWGYTVDPGEDGNTFTGGATQISMSYGKQLTDNFAFGVTLNYAMETLENYTIDGAFFNVGFLYHNEQFLKGLKLGFTAENFGTNITYFENDENQIHTLPIVMRYALLWDIFKSGKHHIVLEGNASQYKDQNMFGTFGFTYTFNDMISFYASYTTNPIYNPFAGGLRTKIKITNSFLIDVTGAYSMTKNFGNKIVFDVGIMTF